MKLGSLFDGIGGFPLVGSWLGFEPVWASEIEDKPISITKRHFPGMVHLGDITQINGANIEPVDVITFGSPCQNLSVAGKQEGLQGSQSSLFADAVRIIYEMREKTNGKYPKYAIWENVPGAFSRNKGLDFRTVLSEIAQADIPMPQFGKWAKAGMVKSENCGIAWRTLDAQYWGVPQRRKRIFLVADFRDEPRPEILFEPEGVSGYFAQGGSAGQGVAGGAADCLRAAGFIGSSPKSAGSIGFEIEKAPTLRTGIKADVLVIENHSQDGRCKIRKDGIAQTLSGQMGTGGNNVPLLMSYSEQVRHLTSLECERLQGFPDNWTKYGHDGEAISDTQRYKALGNSVALPCVEYVLQQIESEVPK